MCESKCECLLFAILLCAKRSKVASLYESSSSIFRQSSVCEVEKAFSRVQQLYISNIDSAGLVEQHRARKVLKIPQKFAAQKQKQLEHFRL